MNPTPGSQVFPTSAFLTVSIRGLGKESWQACVHQPWHRPPEVLGKKWQATAGELMVKSDCLVAGMHTLGNVPIKTIFH